MDGQAHQDATPLPIPPIPSRSLATKRHAEMLKADEEQSKLFYNSQMREDLKEEDEILTPPQTPGWLCP